MAQQDTGLGWSAKNEWLLQATGVIANIVVASGALPVMSNPTKNDIALNGVTLWENPNNGQWCKAVAGSPGVYGFAWKTSTALSPGAVAADNTAVFYYAYSYSRSVLTKTINVAVPNHSGWYFESVSQGITTSVNPTSDVPVYEAASQGDAAGLAVDVILNSVYSVEKVNSGYAVACVAKWKTDNNILFTTPVLISSVTEYADMTTTGPYNVAKLNIRLDGVQFYMSFFDIVDKSITSALEEADLSMFKLDLDQVFRLIAQSGMANIQVTETVDPYEDFGYTEEDAGEINPDPQDDDIDFDDLPTKSFATAGFCRIFNPDVSDLNDLASYMWTDQNFLQTVINHLKQILENPIEAIISLSMVPVQPPVGPSKVPVNVMFINTGVSMRPVTSQFVTVDCGTTVLQECYGGALDYNPYTRVQIYLPYVGIVQLDTDEVMAKTLHLQYHVDVVTGICCAEIKADNKLLYSFSGHCAVSQPITSADFSSYLNAAVAAAKVAVGVATGSAEVTASAAAAQAPPEVSSSTRGTQSLALIPSSSGPIGPHLGSPGGSHAWTDFSNIPESSGGGNMSWGELARPGNVNTVASAMGGKMVVQHSGGFSGNSGYLAKRRPYLIVIRPRIANPKNYAQHFGRTSMEYLNLGSCTGYTKVQSVHLSGFDATNPELSEISSLLKGGVLM